jgi:ABC-type lipoprotein export system ATPase subunit
MNITLDHIMPEPLVSINHGPDSIWGNKALLKKGNRICLNASSGKGKSTFTTTIFGLRNDYTGTLYYDDRDIRTFGPDEWTEIRQSKVSVVFQDLQLFPDLTVKENLILKNSITDTFTEQELKSFLERLEIDNKWEQKCGLLSMGQQQRVAIIRSMAQPFEWLIMDEPFSHLDVENANRCLKIIHERTMDQGAGFVLTTLGDSHGYEYDYELKL